MSNFKCDTCGTDIIDSPNGYITECPHYPFVSGEQERIKKTRDKKIKEMLDARVVLERMYVDEKRMWDDEEKIKKELGVDMNFKDSVVGKAFILAIDCLNDLAHAIAQKLEGFK